MLACCFIICVHGVPQEVDLLLIKWDTAAKALEIAEAAYEASELTTRPTALIGGCCCFGRTKVHAALDFCLPRMLIAGLGPISVPQLSFPRRPAAARTALLPGLCHR